MVLPCDHKKAYMTPEQAAAAAKNLAGADTEGKNALTDTMGQFSGYSVPGTL